jgi:hypothetical protein
LVTRTGWCRYSSIPKPQNFEYCIEIPDWKDLRSHGASTGNVNKIVAIHGTNFVEYTRTSPTTVSQTIIMDLLDFVSTIDTYSKHFSAMYIAENLYIAKFDLTDDINGAVLLFTSMANARLIHPEIKDTTGYLWHKTDNGRNALCLFGGFLADGRGKIVCFSSQLGVTLNDGSNKFGYNAGNYSKFMQTT